MADFAITINGNNQEITFGELPHSQILNLCPFMRVDQFPQRFFQNLQDGTSHFRIWVNAATGRGTETIGGADCYAGPIPGREDYEYNRYFSRLFYELKEDRNQLEYEGEDVLNLNIENFERDMDYFGVFESYFDDLDDEQVEEEDMRLAQEAQEGREDNDPMDIDEKTDILD